ncbi:hypothetical protein LguiA_014247 [Lonicera macranthoides]
MEETVFIQSQKHNLQTTGRKFVAGGSSKDPWVVAREGSVADVDSALALLKKNGGNINSRNTFGLTPLHIATWRNHIPIVRRLLAAGADPNARDGESGWSSLHRAMHFGHLAVASVLLQFGASITLEDSKSRTPVDLFSGPVLQAVGTVDNSVVTEVFSWGSGVNYQLGTGNAHIQKLPCKVDSLHGSFIKSVSSAKFHSVAVSAKGEVFTWGFGRGGRLGHPDFDIHSGQAAVITPRQVTYGLGARRVKTVAAAKHHTVVATEGGEVFTWGSNREGQLGYTSVDTQATPRRVSSLKSRIVAVAAANKHTAVVSESGEVFTWGCNKEGQLGYGTSNSGSNYTPRVVEYLKGKFFMGVATAKYHTIVLGGDGEVFTWGHRLVSPRRVVIARNIKKSGTTTLKFHRKERLHVVAIAAGMVHSMALTDDGALFYWVSSDPNLRCQQLYPFCGKTVVSISAGKYWTSAVTSTGDVYMWDGKKRKDEVPVVTRLHGVKRATSVSVGETHLLIISSLYHLVYPHNFVNNNDNHEKPQSKVRNVEIEELDEEFVYNDMDSVDSVVLATTQNKDDEIGNRGVPSLKSLCEKAAAECLVEPRSALQLLEIADSLDADDLRKHCEELVLRNLDYIITVSTHAIANASLDILANLEKSLDLKSSEPWSHRRLPTPTATFPAIVNSEEEDSKSDYYLRTRDNYHHTKKSASKKEKNLSLDNFLQPYNEDVSQSDGRQVRALKKKLQQIEMLEEKQSKGHVLDDQQIAKLHTRSELESELAGLGVPIESFKTKASNSSVSQGVKKAEVSKKQRRKQRVAAQAEAVSSCCGVDVQPNVVKGFKHVEISQFKQEGDEVEIEGPVMEKVPKESPLVAKKGQSLSDISKTKNPSLIASKKKNRKGGLSLFLSGALDDTPKKEASPPPPTPKSEGPAWGGAKVPMGSTSLREILDQQGKTKGGINLSGNKDHQVEEVLVCDVNKSVGKVQLSSFLPSSPIPVVSARSSSQVGPDGEKSTPPWAASGTSPIVSRPSLKAIQLQQGLAHSPNSRTTGFSITTGQGSPSDANGSNRWFKPEVDTPSSIRSIQIEERAMKDLKRFYSSVKIVKNQS